MKWREVKILCAGMCVCTIAAAISSSEPVIPEQSMENMVAIENMVTTESIEMENATGVAEIENSGDRNIESDAVTETLHDSEEIIRNDGAVEEYSLENAGIEGSAEQEIGMERHTVYEVGAGVEESNLVIADVTNYVNIRNIPSEEGEILGKLYDDSVGRIHGEENGWYYIQSGSVVGYVKAEFVLTGEQAEQRAREVGTRLAEVTTTTLKVRKEPTTDSIVLGLVPGGDVLGVLEEVEGWIKVDVEDGPGYISTEYARVYTENVEAESREEEAARLKKEEEARKKAEAAAKEALRKQQALNSQANHTGTSSGSSQNQGNSGIGGSGNLNSGNSGGSGSSSSGSGGGGSNTMVENNVVEESNVSTLGQQIADYAMKFIGNPYVYGGTSLTNGADCSGFVQSVYKQFGISLPRTSGEQGRAGSAVDGLSNARPGDLVWYSGHIGIYIGNNQIVHASSPKNGIITSNANYRTILGIRRIV